MADFRRMGRAGSAIFAFALAAFLSASGAFTQTAAATEPGFQYFAGTPSTSQAGGHPDVELKLTINVDNPFVDEECEGASGCLSSRLFRIHWPTGFIGNPHVALTCSLSEFNQAACPVDSQLGKVVVEGEEQGEVVGLYVPLYNMETNPEQAGLLGFTVPFFKVPVFFELTSRTDGDYGLDAVSTPQAHLPFEKFTTVLWGVPASPDNDVDRFISPLTGTGACYIGIFGPDVKGCPPGLSFVSPTFADSTVAERPFLQNPTTCGVPLKMTGSIEYYGGLEGHAESPWPPTTGCNQAGFDPSVVAKPTTLQTDTASGLDLNVKVPQTQSPNTPSPSELRTGRVTLPEGFSINAGAADGKVACGEAESMIGTLLGATCPEFSKIATLTLDVAALPAPIPGAIYLAEPTADDPYPFILAADGFATHVKLHGSTQVDPQTGQVTLALEELPQAPLQEFALHIFGSERGIFSTPTECGTFPVESEFIPWNTALTTRHVTSFMTFDSGPNGGPCPSGARPFAPKLRAGSSNNTAGSHAPFSFAFSREDGEQNLTGVSVTTPPGFTATLKGVPYCPESAIARLSAPSYAGRSEQSSAVCPQTSQIGTAVAGAGAGTHPLHVPGKVYLAGPYKGAPLSLVISIPAVSGPYDLGTVAVRAAIEVDPTTARVSTTSDPLPQILEGVPLRTRSVSVSLDRPGFTLNPTDCSPFSVDTSIFGAQGTSANLASHFQVANCANLPFAPKLGLKLLGSTKRLGHPALRATLRADRGESNIATTVVAMPDTLQLDNAHIGTVCTRVQFAADACPERSLIGQATAETPLLDQPLSGPVYLRPSGNRLPDVVADLRGQFDIELVGRIDTTKQDGLRTTFESLPDAPVSKFTLELQGASKGLLINSKDLCKNPQKASVRMGGQNGALRSSRVKLQSACTKKAKRKAKRSKRQSLGRAEGGR